MKHLKGCFYLGCRGGCPVLGGIFVFLLEIGSSVNSPWRSAQLIPNGSVLLFFNVGLYVWDQYNSNCRNITVRGNWVNWTKKDGTVAGAWNGNNCGTIEGWSDNAWQALIGPDFAEGLY